MTSELERIARLEERLGHMGDTMEKMAGKVDDLHELLLQAKGARWAIIAVASFAGFLSGKIGSIAGFFATR